jgi:transposase-like protein
MSNSENHSSSVSMDIKMKRKTYDGLFKARLVTEWINGGKNLIELAEQHSVHPNQIKNWKSLLLKGASQVLDDRRRSKCR